MNRILYQLSDTFYEYYHKSITKELITKLPDTISDDFFDEILYYELNFFLD